MTTEQMTTEQFLLQENAFHTKNKRLRKLAVLTPLAGLVVIGLMSNSNSSGIGAILILAAYFFPSIIAGCRGHHQKNAILVLNLFLGWTGLGWIAALVWAATATKEQLT